MSWYALERGWMDNPKFGSEPYTKAMAWCYMIENAAYKPYKKYVGYNIIDLERGELFVSERYLAEAWHWSKKKVRNFLLFLEDDEAIEIIKDKKGTTIKIVNYKKYQDKIIKTSEEEPPKDHEGTTTEPQGDHEGTKEEQIKTTKTKDSKKTKAKKTLVKFDGVVHLEWTDWALKNGLSQRSVNIERENFIEYWTEGKGKGQKRENWKLTWNSWIRKNHEYGNAAVNGKSKLSENYTDWEEEIETQGSLI